MTAHRRPRPVRLEAEGYRELARYASDVVLIVDADACVQYLSPSAERLMGYRADEWLGHSALEVIHPDDVELAAGAFGRALARPGLNEPLEVRVRRFDNRWRWFELVATNLLDHPAIRGVVLCARDITERVEAHEALQRSDERLNALLRHSSDVVAVITAEGELSYLSESAAQLFGYPYGSHLDATMMDFVHPDDRARVLDALAVALRTTERHTSVELRVGRADGTWRDLELVATNCIDDPAVNGIVCNLRDITDLRGAQNAVTANARRSEAMLANLSDLVSVIDAGGNMTYLSPATRRLLGRRAADRHGASIFDYVHPDDAERAADQLTHALANPGLLAPFETRVLHDDGTYRTFEVRANNLLDDPAVKGIIVNSRDITERVNAETALHDSERLYRTIVETADEGIWMIDANAVTTFANPRMAQMHGTTSDAMIGRHVFEFMGDEGRQVTKHYLERRRAGIAEHHDFKFVRSDGSTYWATMSASPLIDQDGTYQGAIALVTDVTQRRQAEAALREVELERRRHEAERERLRLEAELQQTRRLESLGRLAAGVAHDFNNLVGVILNYAAAAAKRLDPTDPVANDVGHIHHAAEQAAGVTRKLLTFGRADPVNPEIVDLNELVDSVTQLVDRSFGERITIATQLAAGGCHIYADRGQIEQLLMNLLVNARDALPSGGTITVTTQRSTDPALPAPDSTGCDTVLTVADDGIGMSPDVVVRAFEPFFTTKPAESGTGLGLATVHAIVTRAQGHVSINSEVAVGTTVRVRLPASP